MVIGGIIALAVAAVAYFVAHSQQKSLRDMTLSETLTCGELGQLSAAAAEAVGTGSFGQACEVVGVAAPGGQGALTAPESGREVVWHRTLLTEHYTTTESDSQGKSREVDKTRIVAQHVSEDPFLVKDAAGEIIVDPRGADMDEPFVLAEANDRTGTVTMSRPEKGRFTISTKTEELLNSAGTRVAIATSIAVVAGVAGVVLLVLGLLG